MNTIRLEPHRNGIVVLTIDMPGKSANVLTEEVWSDLAATTEQLAAAPPAGVILVSAKPSIFVAGADLNLIAQSLDWSDDRIAQFCDDGREIMARFSELPFVSVAAVHGVCVGGGMELALWCDQRIAASDGKTLFGMPEVKLGLVPGWAGTVRLPRLIGLEPAIDLITSGRLIDSAAALDAGLVSAVVPREQLIEEATRRIESETASESWRSRRSAMTGAVGNLPADLTKVAGKAQNRIDANADVDRSAPTIVLEHMIETAPLDARQACHSESRAMARVWGSAENRGLLHWFFTEERAKKTRAAPAELPAISRIGIVGAGQMGRQIARLAARARCEVLLFDADGTKLRQAVDELKGEEIPDRLAAAKSVESLAGCDLVIESIVEKLSVKRLLFERLSRIVSPEAILATNTSTIPLHDLASAVSNPQRLVGLHFCCPVEPMKLVEIIRGTGTSQTTLGVAIGLVRSFGKTPVMVADHPGFVVNRLLCPVFDQALLFLQAGIPAADIDASLRRFGFAAGPLEMIDFIGVDTIMYAGETFLRTLPGLISLTPVLPALVKRGRLGRKSGIGFYRYERFDSPPVDDAELPQILSRYQKEQLRLAEDEIAARLLERMVDAGRQLLADRTVPDAMDVDLCSVLGTTFPAVKGGLLFWADGGTATGDVNK